jgi:hypothetical protein
MTRLIGLYPRAWRTRYEDEFLALLSDRPPDLSDRLDIVRGALDARLHPQPDTSSGAPEGDPWPVRMGWLTLLGGVLLIVAIFLAINGPLIVEGGGSYRDGSAALPVLLLAVILLGVGMLGVVIELPAPARAARTSAYVSALAGLLWAGAPWLVWAGLIAFLGLLVIGLAAWRAGRWSLLELAILFASILPAWTVGLAASSGMVELPTSNPDLQFVFFAMLLPSWLVVGGSLARVPRRAIASSPPGP